MARNERGRVPSPLTGEVREGVAATAVLVATPSPEDMVARMSEATSGNDREAGPGFRVRSSGLRDYAYSFQTALFADTASRSRRASARVLLGSPTLSNQRAQGMPGARCARSLACSVKNTRVSHHGHTGITRHSLGNGFTAYFVLSPAIGLVCHRHLRFPADLTPASRRQDHTTSPSAS
jgi:hypothetical protein